MLNIRDTEDQKIFVTADPHLRHQRDFVWKARGHENADKHDEAVVNTINETVRPNDILFVLGDFCLNTTIDQFEAFLNVIKCQNLWYVWGNHNNPHEKNVYKKIVEGMNLPKILPFDTEIYPLAYKNFIYLGYYKEIIWNGQYTVIGHYPIYVWNEMQHGAWMLCGHSHNGCVMSQAETEGGKILDVGWDGHGKPWSFSEVTEIMNKKQFIVVDHHE